MYEPVIQVEAQGNIAKAETVAAPAADRRLRLYFLDNLKVLLAILVVLHHAGQPYGPGGGWPVAVETDGISMILLGIFFSVNAAFFMGLFFMISAYFVPGSVDRKGPLKFMADRLQRLGTPILIFALAVFPLMLYLLNPGRQPFLDYYISYVNIVSPDSSLSLGHLWFLGMLLVFSTVYLALRLVTKKPQWHKSTFPRNRRILAFALIIGLVSFVIRIWSPINTWVPILNLFEPAHITQYTMLFAAGIVAYRNGWLNEIPATTAKFWWRVAGLMVLGLFAIHIVFGDNPGGGLSLAALLESVREGLLCVGLCIGLLSLFKNRYNVQGRLSKTLADNAYTVYLIHIPVVIFLQWLLVGVAIHPLLKFAIVGAIAVPACFAIAHFGVRRIPFVRDVL